MCSLCAPLLMEPDPVERARVLQRLAVLNDEDTAPPGAPAMLAWSGALHPSAFICEETPDSGGESERAGKPAP